MSGVYTQDTLKALSKAQSIDFFVKMKDQTNSTIDYSRCECLEIIGIPKQLSQRIWNTLSVKLLLVLVLTLEKTE